jgi:hypothetical protein
VEYRPINYVLFDISFKGKPVRSSRCLGCPNILWHVYHDSGHVAVVAHRSATAFLGSSVVVELIIFFLLFLSFDIPSRQNLQTMYNGGTVPISKLKPPFYVSEGSRGRILKSVSARETIARNSGRNWSQ